MKVPFSGIKPSGTVSKEEEKRDLKTGRIMKTMDEVRAKRMKRVCLCVYMCGLVRTIWFDVERVVYA